MMNTDKNKPKGEASQKLPADQDCPVCGSAMIEVDGREQCFREHKPAQAGHSPLPWRVADNRIMASDNTTVAVMRITATDIDAKLIVASVNNAGKLAEALRGVQWKITAFGSHWEPSQAEREAIAQALAAWEAGEMNETRGEVV